MPIHLILDSIVTDRQNPEQSERELKSIVEEYPYFSFAHYAILKNKWKDKAYSSHEASLSALHFNKLFLLNKRLNENDNLNEDQAVKKKAKKKSNGSVADGNAGFEKSLETDAVLQKFQSGFEEGSPVNDAEVVVENNSSQIEEIAADGTIQTVVPNPIMEQPEAPVEEALVNNVPSDNDDEQGSKPKNEIIEPAQVTEHENEQPVNLTEPIVNNETGQIELNNEEVAETFEHEISENSPLEQTLPETGEKPSWALRIEKDLAEPLGELKIVPLHTTDYFASQGIKISEEYQQNRSEGQKRSFTEWLKTMKKLNSGYSTDAERPIDPTVEQLAKKSNQPEEVVTEAMAATFIQQGKPAKAIEIYRKLSLNNPSKSAYFAGLIENLKK